MTDGFDAVVVGAGSAGGVLAARPAEAGRSVQLLADFGRESATMPTELTDAYNSTATEYDWTTIRCCGSRSAPAILLRDRRGRCC
jgi:choline dehydrogenase-like flavoprotein